jgi:hypothetical protein
MANPLMMRLAGDTGSPPADAAGRVDVQTVGASAIVHEPTVLAEDEHRLNSI